MRIEILHVRDSDGGCDETLFVDGVEIVTWGEGKTPDVDVTIEDVDPGRGYTRSDWNERVEEVEANKDFSPSFKAALLASLESNGSSPYIDDDEGAF